MCRVRFVTSMLLIAMVALRLGLGIDAPAAVPPLVGGSLVVGLLLATNVVARRLSETWTPASAANAEVAADLVTATLLLWVLAPVASPQVLPIGHLIVAMEAGSRLSSRRSLALAGVALLLPVLVLRRLALAPWMTPDGATNVAGNAALILVIPTLLAVLHALIDSRRSAQQLASDQQDQLEESMAALQERNEELDHFAERVAHDLRGPLSVIHGSLQLLALERLDDASRKTVVATTHSASTRMNDMIRALLAHTRAVGTPITSSTVAVADVVREAVIASDLEGHNVERRGLDVNISCTPPLIVQSLQNLFSNSVKYAHPDRPLHIVVSASSAGEHVRIEVADNGIGVAADDRHRLLAHGEQADPGNPGFGIGLSTVASVVRRHGGEVELGDSTAGGLLVAITLPAG